MSFHFNILEGNLDFFYNALYKEKDNSINAEMIEASLKEIFCQVYELASVCVSKSSREINQEYAEELAYNFSKIRVIMENSLNFLAKHLKITNKIAENVLEEAFHSSLGFLNKVSDMVVLTNQKMQITDQTTWQQMEQLAKQGELINHAEEFGIEVEKNHISRYKIIENSKKTNHEFDHPTQWDNEYVVEIMKQLWEEREVVDVAQFEEELDSKTTAQKIKEFFAKFKNRRLKRLGTPEENQRQIYQDLENNLDDRYKVPKDQLKPIEKQDTRKHTREQEKQ